MELDERYQVWIHIQGSNGDISGNGYASPDRAEATVGRRIENPTNDAVISLDLASDEVVRVRVRKGTIGPFRERLNRLFAGQWQEESS